MVGGNPSVGGGGFAASPAGTAPLYYKSAEIASGSAKNLCKKSEDVGGCAFFAACLPCLYLLFCPLSPQPPSPAGKGVPQSLFRRGLRPRHPCIYPLAALTEPAKQVPGGGLARLVACLPCLWFTFLPPIPPAPFPSGEGGDFRLFHARGFAPCIPGAEPRRHSQSLPSRYPKWGFASCEAGLRRRSDTLRRCAFGVASSAQNR